MNDTPLAPGSGEEQTTCKFGHMALISVLCSVLYLAGNGSISLWDRDEAWYSQAAREMVERGDYIVPMFNGQPRYRKPILIYWLMAAAYSIVGDNEQGARLFSAVAGTVTCLLTYRLGTRIGGHAVGLAAGLMLAVAPFMVIESKLATTDAVLTAMLTGAMSCLWELRATGFSRHWSLAFWSLIGMAILTKGPFGPVFVAMAALAWLTLSRDWGVLRRLNWIVGIALVMVICLPWGVAIYLATNGQFYAVAVGEQAFGHSLSAVNEHRGFPGYYAVLTLAGFLPWTLAASHAFSGFRRWARESGPGSFLLGWIIGPMIMLEIMRTKLPQYYLPAFPAWAILFAWGIVRFHASANFLANSVSGKWRVLALGILGVAGAVSAATLAVSRLPPELLAPSLVAATILGSGTEIAVIMFWRLQDRIAWSAMVGTWWLIALVLCAWLLPRADRYRVTRASAEALRAEAATGTSIVLFRFREPSLVFYVGRPLPTFSSPKRLADYLQGHEIVCTLLRDADVRKLRKSGIAIESCRPIEAQVIDGFGQPAIFLARLSLATDRNSAALDGEVRGRPSRK